MSASPSGLESLALLEQHRKLIEESAIRYEVAHARGYVSASTPQTLRIYGFSAGQSKRVPALVIPLFGTTGEIVFNQMRPDQPRESAGKLVKYETPARVRMALDVHPFMTARLGDPSIPLLITEGIRKADSATLRGMTTIGLLGVWTWRGSNENGGKTALPDWEDVALNDRHVFLCFDSDASLKRSVRDALDRLGAFLQGRGAVVHLAQLDPGPAGAKTGLDDYLAGGGDLDELLARAEVIGERKRSTETRARTSTPAPAPEYESRSLADVVAAFRRWLHLPDPGALYVALATVVANRLPGDPVWTLLVGPSSCGKTEILASLGGLDEVEPAATLTEAALLSGVPRKDVAKGATGGLLKKVGDYGVLTLKDFGSVLSMHRDARAGVLAALREVYDGSWDRPVGADGGRTLHWDGKLGLVAGVTTVVDRHHAVVDSLGSRFAFYRVDVDERKLQATRALGHRRKGQGMRAELREAVAGLFAGIELDTVQELSEADTTRLVELADFVTVARSPVERDSYAPREIELIPDAEAPARFAIVLASLLEALRLLGLDDSYAWTLVAKIALDSMPAQRSKVIARLAAGVSNTADVATELGLPTTTARRTLEDLAAHGLVDREKAGEGKADTWRLAGWAATAYAAVTVPETSHTSISVSTSKNTHTVYDDISGKVGI